jgi:hypothetical protein
MYESQISLSSVKPFCLIFGISVFPIHVFLDFAWFYQAIVIVLYNRRHRIVPHPFEFMIQKSSYRLTL